jgi:lipopolysaccharide export system protein LptC
MSEAANKERTTKQSWAVPGSSHDRVIRIAKVVLPSAVGVLVAVLALAPLEKNGDVSFILDKNKVANSPERMRADTARYTGDDDQGRPFVILAQSAIQRSSNVPIVDISGMAARLELKDGPGLVVANHARYDLDTQQAAVVGTVQARAPDAYQLTTSNVTLDLKQKQITGSGGVQGQMRLGDFTAGRLKADLDSRTVNLDQGVRLKIVQGAVR